MAVHRSRRAREVDAGAKADFFATTESLGSATASLRICRKTFRPRATSLTRVKACHLGRPAPPPVCGCFTGLRLDREGSFGHPQQLRVHATRVQGYDALLVFAEEERWQPSVKAAASVRPDAVRVTFGIERRHSQEQPGADLAADLLPVKAAVWNIGI